MLSRWFVAACVVGVLLGAAPVGAAPEPLGGAGKETERVPGQVVVRYAGDAERAEVRERYDLDKVEALGLRNTELVQVELGTVAETVSELASDPAVAYAEPNYVYRASGLPNDPLFPRLWGLHQDSDVDMDAPQAWDITTGSPSVTVAVVDTGVAIDHPDLAPNVWRNPGESGGGKESNGIDDDRNGYVDDFQGWDWVGDDSRPSDLHGHGTHVAATIGAVGDNATGITGVAMNARIMALRALNSDGAGTTAELASAFTYAAHNGAKVVNVSLGGDGYSLSVLNAIAAAPDTLFVVAAGNAGANNDLGSSYPCNYPAPNIVCVAAMDSTDQLAGFSNYGATTVDLAAPGVGILSLQPAFETRFYEDFTGGPGTRWTTGGVNGTWGPEPDGSVSDSPGALYQDGADNWIATAAPFDLSGMDDCLLRYSLELDVEEGNDVFAVEASRDGSAWERAGAWTGSTEGAWDRMSESLFDYDGARSLYLRFRLVANGSVTGDGAAVDSVSVRCSSPSYTGTELLYAGGTSMAAPHVSGAAALAWSAQPDASTLDVSHALLDGAVDGPAYAGKTVSGGRLNACRTVVLLASLPESRCADSTATSSPSPTPSLSPSPTPTPASSPTPTPSASPSPTASPTPEPTATPTPTPIPEATPSPTPAPEDEKTQPLYVHERTVRLRLDGNVARGRVRTPDGFDSCRAHVPVKILRNGRVVDKLTTNDDGRFTAKLPDERGRYVAIAPQLKAGDGDLCERARSRTRKA